MILEKRKCEFCGKEYQPKQAFQRFCCPHCCYKNKLMQAKTEKAEAKKKKKTINKKPAFSIKPWDINDPECREVALFLKTIKPIDFKALAADQEAERQARLRASVGSIGGRYYPRGRKPR